MLAEVDTNLGTTKVVLPSTIGVFLWLVDGDHPERQLRTKLWDSSKLRLVGCAGSGHHKHAPDWTRCGKTWSLLSWQACFTALAMALGKAGDGWSCSTVLKCGCDGRQILDGFKWAMLESSDHGWFSSESGKREKASCHFLAVMNVSVVHVKEGWTFE